MSSAVLIFCGLSDGKACSNKRLWNRGKGKVSSPRFIFYILEVGITGAKDRAYAASELSVKLTELYEGARHEYGSALSPLARCCFFTGLCSDSGCITQFSAKNVPVADKSWVNNELSGCVHESKS